MHKKVQQAPEPSPKVDSAAGSGDNQYRACSGMAAGRCECICTHSEAKTFVGWPGVKKGNRSHFSAGKTSGTDRYSAKGTWIGLLRTGVKLFSLNPLSDCLGHLGKKACPEKTR